MNPLKELASATKKGDGLLLQTASPETMRFRRVASGVSPKGSVPGEVGGGVEAFQPRQLSPQLSPRELEEDIELTEEEQNAIQADPNLLNLMEVEFDPWHYNAYKPRAVEEAANDVPGYKSASDAPDIDLTGIPYE